MSTLSVTRECHRKALCGSLSSVCQVPAGCPSFQVSGDMRRVFDAWEADKSARDGAVRRVEQELKDAIAARAQDAEAFEQAVMDELRAIRVELEAER